MEPNDAKESVRAAASLLQMPVGDLLAILRRSWSCRVLDAQLSTMPKGCGWETTSAEDGFWVRFTDHEGVSLDGPWDKTIDIDAPTEDAARHLAAVWTWPWLKERLTPAQQADIGEYP